MPSIPTGGFHFADPGWLLGLFALPVIALLFFVLSRTKHSTLHLGNPRLVEYSPSILSPHLVPWFLKLVVIALCLVAAARPQAGQKKMEEKKPVTDLFIALDLSSSMLTADLQPNRVTAAKRILSEFLDKVENVRVGVTVFARISFTQCPLTTDIAVVKQLLSNLDVFTVKLDGTAIGDALVSCVGRLQSGSLKDPMAQTSSPSALAQRLFQDKSQTDTDAAPPDTQAIVLLTDGGNNAGQVDPLTAARIAASRGIKIYAIGVGSETPQPVVYLLPDGRRESGVDQYGNPVMSDVVDMPLLKEIARITGGKAYAATDNQALRNILDDIAKLSKRDVTTIAHWEYQELASYFLLAAFLILALDLALEMTVLRTLP